MEKENLKIQYYETGVKSLPDYPSDEGYTAEELKAVFDARSDKEIKEKHNALCDATAEISEEFEAHKESDEAHSALFADVREELESFVKDTDYATADKAGVVKVATFLGVSGLIMTKDGVLNIAEADAVDIEDRRPMTVITAGNFQSALETIGPGIKNGDGEVSLEQTAWSEASKNTAEGTGAVALGGYNKANAKCAMAVNYNNEIQAKNSFAAGSSNIIEKVAESGQEIEAAFVAGHSNIVKAPFQTVIGTYSDATSGDAFVVGNGNADGRKNAFKVTKTGDVTAAGRIKAAEKVECNTLSAESSVTTKSVVAQEKSYIGCGVVTEKAASFAQNVVEGAGAAAFGGSNKIYGRNGVALMTSNTIPENCESVFIAGHANTAAASHQAIFGTYADPAASDVFVVGNGTSAGRKNAFAVDRSGNVRIGGTQIKLGSTVLNEAEIKALKALVSNQSTASEGE